MKNILSYFYHMIIEEDKINNGYFSYHNRLFMLYEYQRNINEIEDLLKLNQEMYYNKYKINKIINNIYNSPITLFDNKYYVLLLINYS